MEAIGKPIVDRYRKQSELSAGNLWLYFTGTANEAETADRIEGELRIMGYDPILQLFDYSSGTKHSQNVIAEKRGSGNGTIQTRSPTQTIRAACPVLRATEKSRTGRRLVHPRALFLRGMHRK